MWACRGECRLVKNRYTYVSYTFKCVLGPGCLHTGNKWAIYRTGQQFYRALYVKSLPMARELHHGAPADSCGFGLIVNH